MKYKRGLKKYFKKVLSPWDLADKEIYKQLVQNWQDFYFSIPKGRSYVLDITDQTTPKDLDNILKLCGLQLLGDSYHGFVNTLEERQILGRVQAGRVRKATRELYKYKNISEPDNLTKELDSKVRSQAMFI
ncbi:MAG: hypothetical protein JEY91_11740 [Spirochaetaceae bacterium]|nr:hypothetical protein [Spirochaetaceae bacterium]